jgi:hypothetical protein
MVRLGDAPYATLKGRVLCDALGGVRSSVESRPAGLHAAMGLRIIPWSKSVTMWTMSLRSHGRWFISYLICVRRQSFDFGMEK